MPALLLLLACLGSSGDPALKSLPTSTSYGTPTTSTSPPTVTTPTIAPGTDSAWIVDTGGPSLPGVTTWDTAAAGTDDSGVGSTNCAPEPSPWLDTGDWPSTRDTATVAAADDHDGDGVDASLDCDDHDPWVYPGAEERCDGVDTDCDPLTGEDGLVTLAGTVTTDTIQAAIDLAVDGDTVLVCPGTYEEELVIDGKNVRLVGIGGAEGTVLTSPTLVNMANGVAVTQADAALVGLTVEGFDLRFTSYFFPVLPGAGVGVGSCASAVLRRSVVRDNQGAQFGGGVGVEDGGELWLLDSEVRGNTGATDGGGLSSQDARVVLRDTVIADNTSFEWGGGAYVSRGSIELERVEVSGNSSYEGGGLSLWYSTATGTEVVVEGNVATGDGGGLAVQSSTLEGTGWSLLGNSALRGGGAFVGPERDSSNGISTVDLDASSVVEGNDASEGGGVAAGYVDWSGGGLLDNTAVEGGAIAAIGGPASFYEVELQGNTAERGGAVALGEATLHLHDSVVQDSVATDVGDGAWLPDTVSLGLYSLGTTWGGATAYPVGLGTPSPLGEATVCNTWLCVDDIATPQGVGVQWLPAPDTLPHPQRIVASPDHILVGDPEAGLVVAWHHDGVDWRLLGPIDTPHRKSHYGRALALHGDTLVVGASAAHVNGSQSGSVWVFQFDGTTWVEQVRLSPSGTAEDYGFGASVALSDDQLFVGVSGYDLDPSGHLGAVYVFDRTPAGSWPLVQLIGNPSPGNDYFGGVHVDGDTLVVAAAYDDQAGIDASGAVHVYERPTGAWAWSTTLTATTPSEYGRYGMAVALEGDLLAVMSDEGVDVWEHFGGMWLRQATLPEATGGGVGLFGTRLVAGDPDRDSFGQATGALFAYDQVAGTWPAPRIVAAPVRHMSDFLGTDLAMIDATRFVTIAPNGLAGPRDGQVVVFDLP